MASNFLPRTILFLLLFIVLRVIVNSEFAEFKCQEKASVCKNQKVEIICNSTLDFHQIELYLCNNMTDVGQLLFNMTTIGESDFQEGKQLKFKNQEVTLVIQNTQFSHRGLYRWRLLSKGSSIKYTRLNVSEPPMISKENGSLICQATVVKPGRRITWSNDLLPGQSEFTSHLDAKGLFKLSSSQPWNDSFDSNGPCCKVVDEKGSQVSCEICYTNSIMRKFSGASMNKHYGIYFPLIIVIFVLIIFVVIKC
ncbi:uncharacterized protein LOC141514204 [Macrotis lagotis]|uniref:uncharacterized protein LOC141514204 n=1 Tax=Macrotis lagotis TaxID=92651 RepID=UPI003D682E8E